MNGHRTPDGTVYLTLREAAQQLGVSTDTLRRRIQAGEMRATREQRPQGFRWLVEVPADTTPQHAAPGRSESAHTAHRPHDDDHRVAVVEAENRVLRETVDRLQRDLEARQRETAELHVLLRQALNGHTHAQLPTSHGDRAASAAQTAADTAQRRPHSPPPPRSSSWWLRAWRAIMNAP